MKHRVLILTAMLFGVMGCKNDPSTPPDGLIVPPVVKAVYVLNEGNFNDPTGARLTVYDVERDTVYRNVYEAANGGSSLGSLGDDMKFYNGKAYIVMSGSRNLIVMNLATHRKELEVTFPGSAVHDLLIDSVRSRLYVTRLFSNSVYVLNLNSLALIDSIAVGANPQGMALSGNRVFICNSGYGSDSTVTVVDATTLQPLGTIALSHGPTGAAVAADGKVWVACSGSATIGGKVFILDPSSLAKVDSVSFSENLWGSILIASDGYAYLLGVTRGSFFGGPVHRIAAGSKAVTLNFISGTFYGLGYDDVAREVYVSDVREFAGDGNVKIYTNAGALRKTFTAQLGPAVFGFRR